MSRRKHLLQSLEQEVEPPGEGQHIVRALGSRGSNIIEVGLRLHLARLGVALDATLVQQGTPVAVC